MGCVSRVEQVSGYDGTQCREPICPFVNGNNSVPSSKYWEKKIVSQVLKLTILSTLYPLYTVHCTLYTVHCTLSRYIVQCTLSAYITHNIHLNCIYSIHRQWAYSAKQNTDYWPICYTDQSVILTNLLYWLLCYTDYSVILTTLLYWLLCFTDNSVILTTLLYWQLCYTNYSVILTNLLYWLLCYTDYFVILTNLLY